MKISCSRYSGLSRSILISSRTTWRSFFTSSESNFGRKNEIGNDVKRDRQMLVENLGVEADLFLGGEGVEHAANGIHFAGDRFGRAALGAFEDHVLHEMREAIFLVDFAARAVANPDPDGNGANVRHGLGNAPPDHWARRVSECRELRWSCYDCDTGGQKEEIGLTKSCTSTSYKDRVRPSLTDDSCADQRSSTLRFNARSDFSSGLSLPYSLV